MNKQIMNTLIFLFLVTTSFGQNVVPVKSFDAVIISPHVQTTFIEGTKEQVTIEGLTVEQEKVNIITKGGTLRIYLDGAKEVTKSEESTIDGVTMKRPIYQGTVLTVTVYYKSLKELSIRGEEMTWIKSKIDQDELRLKIYGDSEVTFEEVNLQKIQTTIYGESLLEIKSGKIYDQKITAYGESRVNTLGIDNNNTKLTAYGSSDINLNVMNLLKVTAYGGTTVGYSGDAQIKKGLTIGDVRIYQIH